MDLARSVGTLSLVLRNQIDSTAVLTGGANKQQLLKRVNETELAKPVELVAPRVKAVTPKPRAVAKKPRAVAKVVPSIPDRECVEVIKEGARHVECF